MLVKLAIINFTRDGFSAVVAPCTVFV